MTVWGFFKFGITVLINHSFMNESINIPQSYFKEKLDFWN